MQVIGDDIIFRLYVGEDKESTACSVSDELGGQDTLIIHQSHTADQTGFKHQHELHSFSHFSITSPVPPHFFFPFRLMSLSAQKAQLHRLKINPNISSHRQKHFRSCTWFPLWTQLFQLLQSDFLLLVQAHHYFHCFTWK